MEAASSITRAEVDVRWGPRHYLFTGRAGDHIVEEMRRQRGFYEYDVLAYAFYRARPGVYVDVGAHVGNHTVFFAEECPSARVIAIEPLKESFDFLRDNVKGARNVALFPGAVHDVWVSCSAVAGPSGNRGKTHVVGDGPIPVVTLDRLLLDEEDIAVIKIDVEGTEPAVLRSGLATIDRDGPMLFVESLEARAAQDVAELLGPLGYRNTHILGVAPVYVWERS